MNALDLIARIQAMPMTHKVVTLFLDGSKREFPVRSEGAAKNYATGESRKIGRKLINRETGETVEVVAVVIEEI